jgi:hypothetical protein
MPLSIITTLVLFIALAATLTLTVLLFRRLLSRHRVRIESRREEDLQDVEGSRGEVGGQNEEERQRQSEDHRQSEVRAPMREEQSEGRSRREGMSQSQISTQNQTSANTQAQTSINDNSATPRPEPTSPSNPIYVLPQRRPGFRTDYGSAKSWWRR